jgi:UDP-glucose:(heptosyl)LPS alpha-1,3-glucosyltransferase
MKIALVIDSLSPTKGGGEGYAANFAKELALHGHKVHIFTRHWDSSFSPLSLTFHRVPLFKGSELLRDLSFGFFCRRMMKAHSFDIIQGFGKSCWYMDVYRPGGGVHRAYLRQNLLSMENPFYRYYRRVLRNASLKDLFFLIMESYQYKQSRMKRIIVNSQLVKGHIEKFYQCPTERIRVVLNGVDLERYHPINKNQPGIDRSKELTLLFVANNFRLKGLLCLIKALGALAKAEPALKFKVFIAGRGKKNYYIKHAEGVGCAGKIIFLGQVEDMVRLYHSTDLLIHPTFYDPSANVCWEAAASGLPVITTRYNGFSELMADGLEDYILTDPRDIARFKDIICDLVDPAKRKEVGGKFRALAEKYPLAHNYQQITQIYQEILQGS